MKKICYLLAIYPHVRPELIWADSIEDAIKEAEARMLPGQCGLLCQFGTTDKVEVGKRAVN